MKKLGLAGVVLAILIVANATIWFINLNSPDHKPFFRILDPDVTITEISGTRHTLGQLTNNSFQSLFFVYQPSDCDGCVQDALRQIDAAHRREENAFFLLVESNPMEIEAFSVHFPEIPIYHIEPESFHDAIKVSTLPLLVRSKNGHIQELIFHVKKTE